MTEKTNSESKSYPENCIDFYQMNRTLRHRLRNLCAGVKMTVDRIAKTTSETHPQVSSRCDIIKNELDNLELFTNRLDLLFDRLPACEPKAMFELISECRYHFVKRYPLCDLIIDGSEVAATFQHGTWLVLLLREILDNAGDAASYQEHAAVSLKWRDNSDSLTITVGNAGQIPEANLHLPPVPFVTEKSRHDGLGLTIAYRVCLETGIDLSLRNGPDNVAVAEITIPRSEMVEHG